MVGAVEVIVNGLGNAHDPAFIVGRLHKTADLVAGIHGIVAAVIEEIADIVLLEDLKDPLIIGVVDLGIGHLVAAGAESGRRGVQQQTQFLGILLIHHKKAVVQNAFDPVLGTVNLGDFFSVQCSADHAIGTGVDDGGGAAGLAKDSCADQFFTHV